MSSLVAFYESGSGGGYSPVDIMNRGLVTVSCPSLNDIRYFVLHELKIQNSSNWPLPQPQGACFKLHFTRNHRLFRAPHGQEGVAGNVQEHWIEVKTWD